MRIALILSVAVILVLLAGLQPALCEGWSLNPFASKTTTEIKKKPIARPAKKQPTVIEKIGTGTKNFFNKTGEAIGLKKPEKKVQYTAATPKPRTITPSNRTAKKSWLPGFMQPEEPKKPTEVKDWLAQPRPEM